MKRILSLMLCAVMLCALFSGCDMRKEQISYGPAAPAGEAYTLNRDGFFYAEADPNGNIIDTFKNGTEVRITEKREVDGQSWGCTEQGWVCLDADYSDFANHEAEYLINQDSADVMEGPGSDFAVKYTRQAGDRIHISQTTCNGQWGMTTDRGWVNMNWLAPFVEESHYAVIREGGTYMCSKPGDTYFSSSWLEVGNRITLQYKLELGFEVWWYSSGKWVNADDIYIEGEMGRNPASGKVIDSTPLNVRRGPTKSHGAIDKLPVGSHVAVMEQIDCGGSDGVWGFTGEGWIYMPLVKIESNTYNP